MTAFTEGNYYARQMRLAEVGEAGQEKLRKGKVLVVGSGGLGSPALSYLAAAGIGTLGICESDRLEISNLHRQTLYRHEDVGAAKAVLAKRRLLEQNPFVDIRVYEALTPENTLELFPKYDLVLDCTDNFPTKFMINDASVLSGVPAIFASIYQYEGQLMGVYRKLGSACMRCLWPEMPEPGCVGSCAEVGVLGAVPGLLGAMQAMEALKYFLGIGEPVRDALVIVDCVSYATQRVKLPKAPGCPVCGGSPRITSIHREEYLPPMDIGIDISTLDSAALASYRIIDIREADEVASQPLEGVPHEHIAMSTWDLDHPPIGAEACLLSCARGMRSQTLAEKLRKKGHHNVFSAREGWQAFHRRMS